MKTLKLSITDMALSGHGIGYDTNNTPILVLGTFIGDVVEVLVYKKTNDHVYGQLKKIITASPDRTTVPTQAPFFSPNMPWEHLSLEAEHRYKEKGVHDLYNKYGNIAMHSLVYPKGLEPTQYRNKVAYSFMHDAKGKLCFALYTRGVDGVEKIPQQVNQLVHSKLEHIGKQFLHFFHQKHIQASDLKYLVLRYSYSIDTVVAQILVPQENRKKIPFKKTDLQKFLEEHTDIQGIVVSHSQAGVRSSFSTKDFYELGDINIIEDVLDKRYSYHPSLFFQIYPKAFEDILHDIRSSIRDIPEHANFSVLDVFAGIGIIGIEIADLVDHVTGIELSALSKKYAHQNAKQNKVENFSFHEMSVDDTLKSIQHDQILIVDPTRAGLSAETCEAINKQQPAYIIYVSCNPETQARDFERIKDHYEIKFLKPYNLFPKTHHVESLLVLKRK